MKSKEKRAYTFLANAPRFPKEHCCVRRLPSLARCLFDKILINFCGMILRWEKWSTWRKICPSVHLLSKYLTWTHQRWNPCFRDERSATKCLSHGFNSLWVRMIFVVNKVALKRFPSSALFSSCQNCAINTLYLFSSWNATTIKTTRRRLETFRYKMLFCIYLVRFDRKVFPCCFSLNLNAVLWYINFEVDK